jgi:endonuclease YncB( thermonuclease family)
MTASAAARHNRGTTRHARVALVIAALLAAAGTAAAAEQTCQLEPAGTAEVAAVRDGRTLLLRDGSELRLAAIETATGSEAALGALALGKTLTLKRLGPEARDRYGRLLAFAFAPDSRQSLQQALLDQGLARVSARIGDKACAEALLTGERAARAANRGLWADPNFAPLRSDDVSGLTAKRGRFALVEGKVLSVRESGGTIYLNFGRRWTRDFSVIIASRLRRSFATAGIEPKSLEGRRVLVRGFIEQRNGPIIEAAAPEQIETVN